MIKIAIYFAYFNKRLVKFCVGSHDIDFDQCANFIYPSLILNP